MRAEARCRCCNKDRRSSASEHGSDDLFSWGWMVVEYHIRSSSSAQLSEPPRVALTGVDNLSLYETPKDLSPTRATETAAPRTRTSDARVIMAAGEDILTFVDWSSTFVERCDEAS